MNSGIVCTGNPGLTTKMFGAIAIWLTGAKSFRMS
jgi:hypothetical protein